MYFWDMVLLRFHFAFTVVPRGAGWVADAMTGAYLPQADRLFTILLSSRGLERRPLRPESFWLLTQDCPGTLLYRHAAIALQQFFSSPPAAGSSPATLAAKVAAAAPLDAAPYLASPKVEDAAMQTVQLDHISRMIDFRTRLQLVARDMVNPIPPNRMLTEFNNCWRRFRDGAPVPANFVLAWFGLGIEQDLQRWPGSPLTMPRERPSGIDASEWPFLVCAHSLPPTDGLALLLLVYGQLNIRQINRLLYRCRHQSGWRWTDRPEDWDPSLSHIVEVWLKVVKCMGTAAGGPRAAGT
jgi:hypothetical protein